MLKKILILGVVCGVSACMGPMAGSDIPADPTLDLKAEVPAVVASVDQDMSFGVLLNNVRLGNGAAAVTYDSRLDQAAQFHAQDMVDRGYFDHISPEGDDVYDRMVAAGYVPVAWGENLAGRQLTEAEALRAWENSPLHEEMMNATSFENFGLGVAGSGSGTRWVLVMGTER